MSALDLSQNGPSITRSYKTLVSLPPADKPSPTYAAWALYSVSAPLQNAFVPVAGPGRDSVLKVQSTGEGELEELIEEFNEGKVQFAFVKVKDPNSGLGKFALIGWCGDGVPERVKGYFNGHLSAVSKLLHGYHVQITARNDQDLTPQSIIDKIAKASGANYAGEPAAISKPSPAPPVATKPLFKPSYPSKVSSAKPAVFRTYGNQTVGKVDADGWGEDAPPVSRTKLESVPSAYTPTKVDINALRVQPSGHNDRPEPVKGAYQPIGKVDIAEIRRKAANEPARDDRPEPVKGAYQPIGKVDIAAIRAQAKPSQESREEAPPPKPVSERTAAFSQAERITALPKPKPAKKFGGGAPSFGTKPLTPGFTPPSVAGVAGASVDYASQGGKTPAQLWAEKKARERGYSGASETAPPAFQSASHTGRSQVSNDGGVSNLANRFSQQRLDPVESNQTGGSVSDLRNKFAGIPVGGPSPQFTGRSASPPPPSPPVSSRPNVSHVGVAMPGFQQRQRSPSPEPVRARTPTPEPARRSPSPEPVRAPSPVRIPIPVAREEEEERPARSFASVVPAALGQSTPKAEPVVPLAAPAGQGLTAIAQYDYEKAEDNELEMTEGEIISDIDQVDDDWWEGTNSKGERGLFPANYVELVSGGAAPAAAATQHEEVAQAAPTPQAAPAQQQATAGPTATAQYDYEAAEDNELSFPEGAKITDVEFPDEDWWSGTYAGKHGLFPANYVELDQ